MHVKYCSVVWLSGWLLLSVPFSLADSTDPSITQAPEVPFLHPRQQGSSQFIAYSPSGDLYNPLNCPIGLSPHTSSNVIACWATTATTGNFPVGCANTSVVVWDKQGPETCGSPGHCQTMTVRKYLNDNDSNPKTVFICGVDPATSGTLYIGTTTAAISTSIPPSTLSTSQVVTSSTIVTTIPPSPSPTDSSSGSSQNLAWVAGPVIGGVVGIAIIALLVWIVIRLRGRRAQAPHPPVPNPTMSQAQVYPPVYMQPPVAEAYSPQPYAAPVEMYSPVSATELPAKTTKY